MANPDWRKGHSGNPSGRPAIDLEIRKARRENFKEVYKHLMVILMETETPSTRAPTKLHKALRATVDLWIETGSPVLMKELLEIIAVKPADSGDQIDARDLETLMLLKQMQALPNEEKLAAVTRLLHINLPAPKEELPSE